MNNKTSGDNMLSLDDQLKKVNDRIEELALLQIGAIYEEDEIEWYRLLDRELSLKLARREALKKQINDEIIDATKNIKIYG